MSENGREGPQSPGSDLEAVQIDPQTGYEFITAHQADFPVAAMCRALGLSRSGYYSWVRRPPSAHARRDDELARRIHAIWSASGGTYGRPRIHAALQREGFRIGQKRVGRLMKSMGLRGGRPPSDR
ncbi:MAG: IS3 family transposase [Gemmatimonadetes bacterium]|nr:IS3 family transposase [Gemmatimonadota bacterium]MYK66056.1 IS3 family transposase [Gemmatimonadota bacterium]